jgi:RNA polymerase sigma-70 factor, ECF subfamily
MMTGSNNQGTEPAMTDEGLMAAVASQDQRAFAALVERHHAAMVRIAFRTLGDSGRAEDAVQEAFLKVWTQAGRFDAARGALKSWLTRMVINVCLDQRRSLRLVSPLEDAATLADDSATPEQAAQQRQGSARLNEALDHLPPRQRAALALFHLEGFTMTETATILDSNVKAVESLLSRGRAALRLLMMPERAGEQVS